MIEYRVEITDSKGQSAKALLHLHVDTSPICLSLTANANNKPTGRWQTLDKGFFAYEAGVVGVGCYPTNPLAWAAMYGGQAIDDSKLIFHLDNFLTYTHANREGEGFIYKQDYIMAEWGKLSWRLLA